MVIQIYGVPEEQITLRELKKGDINDAISLEYELFFCGVGTFTLELPLTTPFAAELVENNLLYLREDDVCFIIKNVKRTSDKITVVGYDLNGMLLDRLTMERDSGVEGTEGKDCISGSTEACVKHFVAYNMISSPDNIRNYPRLAVAEDLGRGIESDSDLVGKECVEDVVRTLCEGAMLGYRVRLELHDSSTEPLLIFDVYEREDHTADQSERNRVIFSEGLYNLTDIERETGITAEKNALWCDTGGQNMFVYKTDESGAVFNPVGWDRREEYMSLSVTDNYNTEEIELTARKQMADKYAQTDSLTIDAGNPLDYGTVYKLGDIVTAYDKKRSVQLNSVISSVLVKRTGTERSVQLSLGERKPKLLDKYAKQNQIQRKEQVDFPPTESTGGGDTIESAIIIQQKDISHLLHEYTIIKYFAGNKAVYAGPANQIIVGQRVFVSSTTFDKTAAPMYAGAVEFTRGWYSNNVQTLTFKPQLTGYNINYTPPMKNVKFVMEGSALSSPVSATTSTQGDYGFTFVYNSIVAPDGVADELKEAFPFGYVTANAYRVAAASTGYGSASMAAIYVGFADIEEFNCAVGLTYEPEYKDEVNETITVVPDSEITSGEEILQLAYAYADNAVQNHESSVNAAIDAVYDSISQTNSSVSANAVQIELNTSAIEAINDPDNGILAQSMLYTDTKTSS